MTIADIRPGDTGEIARVVGEETRIIDLHEGAAIPRRPAADPVTTTAERSFALVPGSTGELPIVGSGPVEFAPYTPPTVHVPGFWERLFYIGHHRAPGHLARLLSWNAAGAR